MRRAAKRDASEAPIVDLLREAGWSVQHLSLKDAPDLLLGKFGVTLLAEVKTGKQQPSAGQKQWHGNWRGAPVLVLRTVEEAVQLNAEVMAMAKREARRR